MDSSPFEEELLDFELLSRSPLLSLSESFSFSLSESGRVLESVLSALGIWYD